MGSWGARGVRSGDPGVPGPGGFHIWCELDVVDVTVWGWLWRPLYNWMKLWLEGSREVAIANHGEGKLVLLVREWGQRRAGGDDA